jgi:hypothetical protein
MKVIGKLSPEETKLIIQSFGTAIDNKELIGGHNRRLMEIAERFGAVDWNEIEIDPEGNVIDKLADGS